MYCLPSLLVYFSRAIVSLLCGLFLVLCKSKGTKRIKAYEDIHNCMSIISIIDTSIFVWACYMLTHNIHIFTYHWIWFPVYYIEWCLLGYAVLSLVSAKEKYWWCPPCVIKSVIKHGWKTQKIINNNLSGQEAYNWSNLCKHAWKLYLAFIVSTSLDLIIFDNHLFDNVFNIGCMFVACMSTILVLRLQPVDVNEIVIHADPLPADKHGTLEQLVNTWESLPSKPYIKEGLTLKMVADEIGISAKLLSAYLNDVKEMNFNSWINNLRVDEVRKELIKNPEADTYDLMVVSGFQNRTSMARAIKQVSGMTLTEIRHR